MVDNPKLLVAITDDNEIVRESLACLLLASKISVGFKAENGRDCIDKMTVQSVKPNVVILDIEMPVMDGYETACELKRHWPETKIIAYSGREDQESKERMIDSGADYFFSKFSYQHHLIELIRAIS